MPRPFASLPKPPYYAVIFTSTHRAEADESAYGETAERMFELAAEQPGYIGHETAGGTEGVAITVSYWRDEDSIRAWKANAEHAIARETGRKRWYAGYTLRVAKIERGYGFGAALG